MEPQRINIAIAGRTNTGKTTLIRTLMKASIGEVSDSPNVTKRGEAYYFEGLQATFIDTPGFQYASVIAMYLDALDENSDFQMPQKWRDKLDYDRDAMTALDNSNIILYTASLSAVPDDSFSEEISIVKRKCSKVVAIINQYQRQLRASSEVEVGNRVKQWESFFRGQSIDNIVIFDAHWDNPAKINQIYDRILNVLDTEERSKFTEGLKIFKQRQLEIRREACGMLADLVKDSTDRANVTVSKKDFNDEQKCESAKDQVARKINGSLAEFVYCASDLYKVAAEHPTTSKDELSLLMQPKANYAGRISTGGGAATILGSFGAFVAGILGGVITGLLTGGVGILPGALAWAQFGGAAGAALGSLFAFSDDGDTVTISINHEHMNNLSITGITLIWGLSSNGYGRGRELSSTETRDIEEQVRRIQASHREINFANSTKVEIIQYCEKILDLLERESV